MRIIPEKITQNEKNNKVFGVAYKGEWYSMFCANGICPLEEGKEYDVDYKEKQGSGGVVFKNIHIKEDKSAITAPDAESDARYNVKPLGVPPIAKKDEMEGRVGPDPYQDKISRIEKMACLKASAFYSQSSQQNIDNAVILYNSLDKEWK